MSSFRPIPDVPEWPSGPSSAAITCGPLCRFGISLDLGLPLFTMNVSSRRIGAPTSLQLKWVDWVNGF